MAPSKKSSTRESVRRLLDEHGTTYACQAGITLRDKPSPLYQLLVLTMLSSARISADIAADTARELFRCGWRTPEKMRDATWQQRVDALGRGGYRRYDESTSIKLEEGALHVLDEHVQDLWPEVAPFFDDMALSKAGELGLPTVPAELAELARGRVADLATALLRV